MLAAQNTLFVRGNLLHPAGLAMQWLGHGQDVQLAGLCTLLGKRLVMGGTGSVVSCGWIGCAG